jgi:hypothetical protein
MTTGLIWTGAAVAAPGPCADVMELATVATGDIGEGWTVVSGTDPQSFDAEVLGVMPDLIGPGRDVIIVEISGPTVGAGGGVWAGMSGSPVYIDHGGGPELAGALAYGFSFGATNIAGLTPAEDMLHVNGLSVSSRAASRVPARIKLPRSVVRKVAAKIGAALPTVGGSLVRLKVPVSISGGLNNQRFQQMKKLPFFKKYKPTMKLTPGASSSGSLSGVVDDLVPGGNFSAALSYGDLTVAGVGTTTYVCDGQALAFGHPMLFSGRTSLGAGSADAITIVDDPLGPYKLANVTSPVGTVDQDRLAGIRAVDGEPPSIPITTVTSSLDSENTHVGETDVVFTEGYPDFAFSHIFSTIDSVFDKIGEGSASYSWTIEGKREDGTPWELHKTNMYVSEFDLSFESAFEIYGELLAIANYPNEDIEITNTEATIDLDETVRDYHIERLLWCHGGACEKVRSLKAFPGDTLKFRAILKPSDGSANQRVTFQFKIPNSAKNWLVAQLLTGRKGTVSASRNEPFTQAITGFAQVAIVFPGQCCPPFAGGGEEGEFFFKNAS